MKQAILEPIELINALMETDEYIESIFTGGSCFRFHLFLKKIYPDSLPYVNDKLDHVITKIGESFYDISGRVVALKSFHPLTKKELQVVQKWSFRRNNLLQIKECPFCEEPICV